MTPPNPLTELAERRLDRLETERNVVENSFGNGPFQDGLLLTRLNELDREIASLRRTREAQMTDLLELASRAERLAGPCRETDRAIYEAVCLDKEMKRLGANSWFCAVDGSSFGFNIDSNPDGQKTKWRGAIPCFTASLDAAMTLVPEGHAFSFRRNCSQDGEVVYCNAQVWPYSTPREDVPHSWANSPDNAPAIALVAAALKARAALENSHG